MLLSSAVCMEWPIVGRVRYARVDGCTTERRHVQCVSAGCGGRVRGVSFSLACVVCDTAKTLQDFDLAWVVGIGGVESGRRVLRCWLRTRAGPDWELGSGVRPLVSAR